MTTTDKRDIIPLIMWFVLFAGIVLLAFLRIWRLFGIGQAYPVFGDVLFIGLYLLWMMIEFPVSKRDATTAGKTISDSMTCQLYGFGQALTILTALWYPSVWRGNHAAHYIGIGIFLVGVLYRLWAIHTLGRFYSHRVQTVSRHRIVASGPYRLIRHPAYAGMILANAGIAIYFFNWATFGAFLFILLPAIILRIAVEEKMLLELDGYAEYAQSRKRLFPVLW